MTAPKPVEQVARDADAIGYVRGLNRAASWTRAFDQDLPGFDRPTCVNLARGLSEMARHAGERVGVAIDYNEPPAPMFHDCCVHDGHGEPVEVRVEWEVCWLATGGGIAMDEQHLPSREAAEVLGPTRVGQYNIVGFSVHHRTHRQFPDGSTWIGPWLDAEPADPWAEATAQIADDLAVNMTRQFGPEGAETASWQHSMPRCEPRTSPVSRRR
jgi:hypothetical protein